MPPERIELSTSPLPMVRSTTELRRPVMTRRTMPPADKMSTARMAVSRYKADMTNPPRNPSGNPPRKPTASEAERLERQAEALRENLRRRKEQSRARQIPSDAPAKDADKDG